MFQGKLAKYVEQKLTVSKRQGSYREACVKFKDFSKTSLEYFTVFKD